MSHCAYPDHELRLVMDNYAAHKKQEVLDWLGENPRIQVHFTPTSASWMNMAEIWFGIIERQAIHRGTLGSVRDLTTAIRTYINGWNNRAHPFVWTKTADQVLKKSQPPNNFKRAPLGQILTFRPLRGDRRSSSERSCRRCGGGV
jgi:hypothetical protein